MLKSINTFNEGKGLPEITVVDIEVIVFDTTSSNTGMPESIVLPLYKTKQLHTYIYLFIIFYTGKTGGLAGLLIEARRQKWVELGKSGSVPPLHIQGCQDHIINLMSKDYEVFLVADVSSALLLVEKKHRATDLVQMLIGKVRRIKRSFRCFMRKDFNITKKLTIPRISDTRFVTNFICIL